MRARAARPPMARTRRAVGTSDGRSASANNTWPQSSRASRERQAWSPRARFAVRAGLCSAESGSIIDVLRAAVGHVQRWLTLGLSMFVESDMHRAGILFLGVLVAASGCATPFETVRARAVERASFDLGCPADSLSATKIGDTTRIGATPRDPGVERTVVGIIGCKQKAVYVVDCVIGSCNAQLNADTKPADQQSGASISGSSP
jgi:hypothetical protein